MQIESILGTNPLVLHRRRRVSRSDHIQLLRRCHRFTVHFDEEAVSIQRPDPLVGNLEAALPGRFHEIPDILLGDGGIALLNGFDHLIEGNETELIHVEPELVGAMTKDE